MKTLRGLKNMECLQHHPIHNTMDAKQTKRMVGLVYNLSSLKLNNYSFEGAGQSLSSLQTSFLTAGVNSSPPNILIKKLLVEATS